MNPEKFIKQYIKDWHSSEEKECNNPGFISALILLMGKVGVSYYEFSGENHYCGNTAILNEIPPAYQLGRGYFCLEFAYSNEFIKVFTGHHNGFWVPEYISIDSKHDNFEEMHSILKSKFIEWGGF